MSNSDLEFENYEILSKLGEGGFSDVYLAIQKTLDRRVVLKVLKTNTINNRAIVRFQNEAKALSKLNHPNIASVYDFGQSAKGDLYLTIEFVDGDDLSTLIQQHDFIEVDDAIDIIIQLCKALDHAHQLGIIHRDIKPANVVITHSVIPEGEADISRLHAKLLDFGISKLTEDATEFSAVTVGSNLLGSPLFMSPEQCEGKPISKFSDHYSLGCVFYNMLCGQPPFLGETALLTMMMHQNEQAEPLAEVASQEIPDGVERIVETLMSKDPARRYDSLLQVVQELEQIHFPQIPSDHESVSESPTARADVNRKMVLVGVLSVLVLIGFSVFLFYLLDINQVRSTVETLPQEKDAESLLPQMPTPAESFRSKTKALTDFQFTDQFAGDEDMAAIAEDPRIQRVDVHKSGVSSKGLRKLKNLKLLMLDTSFCKGVESLDFLEDLPWIQVLDLHDTAIGDKDIPYLIKLKNLKGLRLDGCKLTNRGLRQLSKSDSLINVMLPINANVSSQTIDKLHEELPQCTFLPRYKKSKIELRKENLGISDPYQLAVELNKTPHLKPTSAFYLKSLTIICQSLLASGKLEEAGKSTKQLTKLSLQSGNQNAIATAYHTRAEYEAKRGNNAQARDLCEKSLSLFRATVMANDQALVAVHRAFYVLLSKIGEKERAVRVAEEGIRLFEHYHAAKLERAQEQPASYAAMDAAAMREMVGLYYLYDKHEKAKAAPLFAKNIELLKWLKPGANLLTARNLIELAHSETKADKRKQHYLEGMTMIKNMNFPDEQNAITNYCDAAFSLAQVYYDESNFDDAIKEVQGALAALQKEKKLDTSRDEAYRKLLFLYLSKAGKTAEARAVGEEFERRYHKKPI